MGDRSSGSLGSQATTAGADFERFFRSAYVPLARILSLVTDDPDDCLQDAFLQAHRHWDRVSTYRDPTAWVRLVAIRRVRNRARGRLRLLRAQERVRVLPRVEQVAAAGGDGDLSSAVAALPQRQRTAVALYYYGELSVHEVAAAMEISEGAVKATLHAARGALRVKLEDEE